MNDDLVRVERSDARRPARAASTARLVVPQLIVDAGPAAVEKFLEFFAARIANRRTRAAYGRAVGQFLAWCAARGLGLTAVSPLHVAAYIRTHPGSAPTVKQHLAAIRMLGPPPVVVEHDLPGVRDTLEELGLWEGATENATVCQGLLTNLGSRGLRTDRSLLVIVDGAKALDTAVTQTFGRAALVQRCQVHKGRTILEHLPEAQRPWVKAVLTRASTNSHVKTATRLLQDLARRLDTDYPSAATSVREGLDETLTVLGLGLSERLQRSLATTNAIESLLSRTRHVQRHVKRWRGGTMVLRWVAAGVLEAAKGFRRVQGCQDMPALVAALLARDARLGLGESSEMVA